MTDLAIGRVGNYRLPAFRILADHIGGAGGYAGAASDTSFYAFNGHVTCVKSSLYSLIIVKISFYKPPVKNVSTNARALSTNRVFLSMEVKLQKSYFCLCPFILKS